MKQSLLKKYDLTPSVSIFLIFLIVFFALFLAFPLAYVFKGAFWSIESKFDLTYFKLMVIDPIQRACVLNSFKIGIMVTVLTTLLSIPLAYFLVRYRFFGRGILQGLILVPMIMPPFVGAIGMKQFFAPYGSINLFLMKLRLMSFENPIDWTGGGFWGVILLEMLHLYPIMYLNVAAALANVDPNLEEAAENLGATKFRLFRTVTFPLMLPGYFAGAIIVFIWAFTDLGTPLIFEYRQVLPVQIFNRVNDIHTNPMGYALVVLVIILTLLFFYLSKKVVGSRRYEMMARGHTGSREVEAKPFMTGIIYTFVGGIVLIALLPHISVFLTSLTPNAGKWFMTVLPSEVTSSHYGAVFTHDNTLSSIKNSLFYSTLSTLGDIFLGVLIAYLLTRKRIPGKNILDTTAMLPLALPGIVLAFGYVGCFANLPLIGQALNPRRNPTVLLVIAYSVRRLPYMVRAAYAGFQQTSITLEEASQNLGASPLRTLRKITLPLVIANLVAGGILCFSFAMLEVSSSLILSMIDRFNPITKTIYELFGRLEDGPYISSAMGMLGMVLLAASLVTAGRFLGKRMGELFRA